MSGTDGPLVEAIRNGDFNGTMALLREDREAALKHRRPVTALYRAISAAPHLTRSPEGLWYGQLDRHYECATAAYMVCIGPERSAKRIAVPQKFASRQIPRLFPDDLPVFVAVWSELYQKNPRYWDRIIHYPAMFDWVRRGLVDPPVQDGAVKLLLSHLPATRNPIRFLREHPGLAETTLPLLFTAEIRPSTGAAAVDSQLAPEDPARIDRTIAALVTEGIWDRGDTLMSIDLAWETRTSPFQRRWLQGLRVLLETQ